MFKRFVLDNGIRVVSEKIPYVRSVSIGIWVGTGSRNENNMNNGISHFIEHMLFKGTHKRSAKEIAESIDNIGGQINAFTGKECTCYYTKTLDSHMDIAVDVLSDMYFNSRFADKDIDVERKVILEEIGMYEDSPEELVHDMLSETVWDGNSLGYPILGTENCLQNIDADRIRSYIHENYTPENCVISICGNFDDEKLHDLLIKQFDRKYSDRKESLQFSSADFVKNARVREKDTEQVHLCMGFKGVEHGSRYLYPLLAINNILGGGMSSRLFQKIREEKGLVYSIYSYPSSYKNAGLFTIYAGMNPEQLETVIRMTMEEVNQLRTSGLDKDELERSKEQLKGNYILGLESTSSRMNSIGKSELLLGYILSPQEILEKIDSITMDDIEYVTEKVFDFEKVSLSAVGNIKEDTDLRKFFL